MNFPFFNRILLFVAGVVILMIIVQIYWNYTNYEDEKQKLLIEMKDVLNSAIDHYYELTAKDNTEIIFYPSDTIQSKNPIPVFKGKLSDSTNFFSKHDLIIRGDTVSFDSGRAIKISGNATPAEILTPAQAKEKITVGENFSVNEPRTVKIETLLNKIITSVNKDTLNMQKLDSLVEEELKRKNITVDYGLRHQTRKKKVQEVRSYNLNSQNLISSSSTWLPTESVLVLGFENETFTILKRNSGVIFLSVLLVVTVLSVLIFLLKIINNQKKLSEVKNDLISNVTHEFKTPLSVIQVALEGIIRTSENLDKNKVQDYATASTEQVGKLNALVESLLQTATLSRGELVLEKSQVELVSLVKNVLLKFPKENHGKLLDLTTEQKLIYVIADSLHLENAITNVVDNAIKYGGNKICVILTASEKIKILVRDNGNILKKEHMEDIFDKFFRVPTGDKHNVKGYGIGLFYTRQVLKAHGGDIQVNLNKDMTEFEISLRNER